MADPCSVRDAHPAQVTKPLRGNVRLKRYAWVLQALLSGICSLQELVEERRGK